MPKKHYCIRMNPQTVRSLQAEARKASFVQDKSIGWTTLLRNIVVDWLEKKHGCPAEEEQ
jgi:hypothetical protein